MTSCDLSDTTAGIRVHLRLTWAQEGEHLHLLHHGPSQSSSSSSSSRDSSSSAGELVLSGKNLINLLSLQLVEARCPAGRTSSLRLRMWTHPTGEGGASSRTKSHSLGECLTNQLLVRPVCARDQVYTAKHELVPNLQTGRQTIKIKHLVNDMFHPKHT